MSEIIQLDNIAIYNLGSQYKTIDLRNNIIRRYDVLKKNNLMGIGVNTTEATKLLNKNLKYIIPYKSVKLFGKENGNTFENLYKINEIHKISSMKDILDYFGNFDNYLDKYFDKIKNSVIITEELTENWFNKGGVDIIFVVEKIKDFSINRSDYKSLPYRPRFSIISSNNVSLGKLRIEGLI